MFRMTHKIPMDAYFNAEAPAGTRGHRFHAEGMKNFALAGVLPYSRFGTKDLVAESVDTRSGHLSNVAIETQFNALDTLIWVIPGFAYGYYLWAPRHVKIDAVHVPGSEQVIPAARAAAP
jgi:hypothetical protein